MRSSTVIHYRPELDHSQGDNALRAEYMNLPKIRLLTQLDLSDTPVIALTFELVLIICCLYKNKIQRCVFKLYDVETTAGLWEEASRALSMDKALQ